MALAVTALEFGQLGARRANRATVTFDSSYPTGGEALTAAAFGLSDIQDVFVEQPNTAGIDVRYDSSAEKLVIYDEDNTSGVAAEVANASNQSTVAVRVLVVGI
jgi:hypothetical protein